MKQLIIALTHPIWLRKIHKKRNTWLLLSMGLASTFLLLSFSFPNFSQNSFMLPFLESNDSKVSCTVNSSFLEGSTIEEAIITKMEQIDGVYSKTLNLSMSDDNGNLVAITVIDVEEAEKGVCLNLGSFYGNEHKDAETNFSIDLGQVIFSNNCSLILEGKNGNSIISRRGWVKIENCKDGILSGKFQFEIGEESNIQISSGLFENVKFTSEGF